MYSQKSTEKINDRSIYFCVVIDFRMESNKNGDMVTSNPGKNIACFL